MFPDPADLVVWSDPDLLVINKPAGLLTLPDGYDPGLPYLTGLLTPFYGRLWTVHRLDKDTSGVILLCRNAEAHRMLNTQFEERRVTKTYHALVNGSPGWQRLQALERLQTDGDRHHRTVVDAENGLQAQTDFQVLESFKTAALLEARPHTGRTHQIRVHLAFHGFPLLGDRLYTRTGALPPEGSAPLINRPALHALRLEIVHPGTHETATFEAPYAPDFLDCLEKLRKK